MSASHSRLRYHGLSPHTSQHFVVSTSCSLQVAATNISLDGYLMGAASLHLRLWATSCWWNTCHSSHTGGRRQKRYCCSADRQISSPHSMRAIALVFHKMNWTTVVGAVTLCHVILRTSPIQSSRTSPIQSSKDQWHRLKLISCYLRSPWKLLTRVTGSASSWWSACEKVWVRRGFHTLEPVKYECRDKWRVTAVP